MEFDLIEFTLAPSTDVYNRCRKRHLLLIADFFNVTVLGNATKQVIKDALYIELVSRGILPDDSREDVAEGETAASSPSLPTEHRLDPMVEIKLKELDLELKKQEHEIKVVQLRTVEVEAQRDIRLKTLEIEAETLRRKSVQPVPLPRTRAPPSPAFGIAQLQSSAVNHDPVGDTQPNFDVAKYIKLVPPFREAEVDSYIIAFERIATKLGWPKDMWGLLLQCTFVGKAQEICSSLPIEQSLDYEIVKAAVLRAYELVPEAYRQRFRNLVKAAKQTYVEFAREKKTLFEKWCLANKVMDFEQLQELILLEEFKNCAPEHLVVHLNEQKVGTLSEAAVIAEEFVLTHKAVFPTSRQSKRQFWNTEQSERETFSIQREMADKGRKADVRRSSSKRVCFYCLDSGHLISDCKAWKQKNAAGKSKSVAFAQAVSTPESCFMPVKSTGYEPFLLTGSVSLCADSLSKSISILRDTGATQSFILADALPFLPETYSGTDVLVRGIELGCVRVPLHMVHLQSDLVTGTVPLGVRTELPVDGVSLILGNDLAGGKVFPSPVVVDKPGMAPDPDIAAHFPSVFPSCAVTRAQAQKWEETVNPADSFLSPAEKSLECTLFIKPPAASIDPENPNSTVVNLKFDKDHLIAAQKSDPSLAPCVEAAVLSDDSYGARIAFIWEGGVLMRRWRPRDVDDALAVYQIILPSDYRPQVLQLAHEHPLSGHLGVNKTYKRISRYFFWPGLKSSVSRFCKCCHVCQMVGKPNQTIPSAPLHPIPVVGEPFERLILDCVGPLPKSKSGHQYVLTLMCAATRFPEAVPLRTLKAQAIVKEIVKFCSTFGLPKVIQTDRGTNFTSKMFSQVLKELGVDHQLSSAYHPESQGALERFHQTFKTMLRAYCISPNRDWVEGLPLLMFAVRETVQESLGFSPADLVFGHTVRGPLKLLSEQLLSKHPVSSNILDYVSAFRERLHKACEVAKAHLVTAQSKMKLRYDKTSVKRIFQPGDLVLVLLPVPGSALQAKFDGPYAVEKKLSETDYVISTPDRRRKSRVCHLNMLKGYIRKETSEACVANIVPEIAAIGLSAAYSPVEDNLVVHEVQMSCTRLNNSAVLKDLNAYLAHLRKNQRTDIMDILLCSQISPAKLQFSCMIWM